MNLKFVCVFCGSNSGGKPEYAEAARRLGRVLAIRRIGLVFGGASVGLMGEVAKSALANGGEVIGVIPRSLPEKEIAYKELPDLRVVGSMHERKALMAELSDGFIALPGGLGTLEEFFEALTWAQLGMHRKPCGFLDTCQFWSQLLAFLDYGVGQQFIREEHRAMVLSEESPEALLQRFDEYEAPWVAKWIRREGI